MLHDTKSSVLSSHSYSTSTLTLCSSTCPISAISRLLMELSTWVWSTRDLFSEWRCRMLQNSRTACAPPALWPISHCPVTWSMMTWSESWSRVSCWTRPSLNLTCHTTRSANQALARSPSTSFSPRSSLTWTWATTASTTKALATSVKLSKSTSRSWTLI